MLPVRAKRLNTIKNPYSQTKGRLSGTDPGAMLERALAWKIRYATFNFWWSVPLKASSVPAKSLNSGVVDRVERSVEAVSCDMGGYNHVKLFRIIAEYRLWIIALCLRRLDSRDEVEAAIASLSHLRAAPASFILLAGGTAEGSYRNRV